MLKVFLKIITCINYLINVFLKNLLRMSLLKEMKENLSNIFFFKISFMRIFSFNLNILIIKSNRLIINLSNNKLTMILIHFEL